MIERAQAALGTATWADLLARRYGRASRHRFVGRRYEQEQFRLNYLYEVPQVLLFVLQGPPGIGKTALLARYREIAEEHRALTAVVDRGILTLPGEFAILQTMEILADQLAAAGTPLTTYREVSLDYQRAIRAIDADSTAPARAWNLFDGAADVDPWVQQAWDTYFARSLSLRQSTLIRDPVGTLTERFVQDLNAWAVVRRMVLCFDGWGSADQSPDGSGSPPVSLESWLPDLLCRGQLSTNVWFVLTTQSPLILKWNSLAPVSRTFELQPLPKKESVSLLQELPPRSAPVSVRSTPVSDPAATGDPPGIVMLSEAEALALADQAKGNPLNLSLLASAADATTVNPTSNEAAFLDRYLDGLKPLQQAALLKCTAARYLDEGVLNVLLGEDAAQEARAWLISSPVVIQANAKWYFRPTLRDPLQHLARARIGPAWEAAHQTLFAYYRQRMELESATPHYLDDQWRHNRLEALYHELVQGDEADGLRHVLLSFLEGVRRFYPWAGAVASTWLDAIHTRALTLRTSTDRQVVDKVHALWNTLVERRWGESLVLVDELLTVEELVKPSNMQDIQEQLSDLRYLVASRLALPPDPQPESAPAYTAENSPASDMTQESQPPFSPLARPAHQTATMPEAAETLETAGVAELAEDVSDSSFGLTPDEVPDACEMEPTPMDETETRDATRRETAVELCSDANTRLSRGDYEAAIQGYDEALKHSPDYVVAYYNRGSAYHHIGALDSAITDFARVLELDPEQVAAYRQRGLIYARKGNYERAIQDYDAALALLSEGRDEHAKSSTLGAIVYDRANAHFRLRSYEQALADYTTALEHARDHVEAYLNRGLTYSALGNYPEALRDFNQAIVLAPHQALSFHHRGQVYARMGRYTEALKDYDRALELNPRYASVHNNRGLLYVKIEAYPEAVEAYQHAMALQPDWATPYYNAACAAALMEDVEHACTWLARAIGLRESYRAMAVRDPDLAAIRHNSRFRALVETAA
jgi:tetratricopeptide (TPR) repeat protein